MRYRPHGVTGIGPFPGIKSTMGCLELEVVQVLIAPIEGRRHTCGAAAGSVALGHRQCQHYQPEDRDHTHHTQAAHRVTATQLHARIGPVPWPRELRALATTFDAMLDRLEEAFTRLTQFAADLAHELRTPLNNLMGEAEVALGKAREPA